MKVNSNREVFPVGNSEMQTLIREFDWSGSPVKSIAEWPISLKTVVSVALESQFPVWILWGRKHLTQFYNDAYRPMLGELKHPQFLGRSGKDCWSELWHDVGEAIDNVFAKGQAYKAENYLLIMERNGFPEETYFSFSYSPIRLESGEVGGMFCQCHEDTREVLSVRRLASLRKLSGLLTTIGQVAKFCCQTFKENSRDIPFSLMYEFDYKKSELVLQAASGISAVSSHAPARVSTDKSSELWQMSEVVRTRTPLLLENLKALEGLEDQPWAEAPGRAYVVPIMNSLQTAIEGVIVFGVSSRLKFDEEYSAFLETAAGHAGVLMTGVRNTEVVTSRSEQLAEIAKIKNELAEQLELQVRERTEEANQANEEMRTLARLVSEQVQEPAVIISSYLKLLAVRYKGRLGEDADEYIDKCSRASTTVSHMVDDLWHYLRVDNPDMVNSPIDVSDRIERALRELDELIESSDAKISLPDSTPGLIGNAAQIEHLFSNLIHNAIKFKRPDAAPEIRITCSSLESEILFCVSDNGIGIDSMHSKDIFKPFVRIDSRPDESGTGMGLAIAEKIVSAHNGTIWVEKNEPIGSSFYFTLAKSSN